MLQWISEKAISIQSLILKLAVIHQIHSYKGKTITIKDVEWDLFKDTSIVLMTSNIDKSPDILNIHGSTLDTRS